MKIDDFIDITTDVVSEIRITALWRYKDGSVYRHETEIGVNYEILRELYHTDGYVDPTRFVKVPEAEGAELRQDDWYRDDFENADELAREEAAE
jgi:hypothetical protein